MIKKDLQFPHCYLVVVCMYPMTHTNAGQRYLKYRPVYFNNDDIDRVHSAEIRSNDELLKMSRSEALKLENVDELYHTVNSVKLAANANQGTLHLFRFESKILDADSFFEGYVKQSNTMKDVRKAFEEARI